MLTFRQNRLNMHVDKPETHVISSILHIDHSKDSDPWPLVIEDFQGNTVEIVLEAGDMLFYESSKCFHGRPTKFNGSWYTSVFTHYQPADPEWKVSCVRDEFFSTLLNLSPFTFLHVILNRSQIDLFQLTMQYPLSGFVHQNLCKLDLSSMK